MEIYKPAEEVIYADKVEDELITLDKVLHNMNIQDKGLESIAMAQISPDGLQETSAFRHQFLVCVWKQLQKICSTTTAEKGGAWQHSRTVDLWSDDSYLKSVAAGKGAIAAVIKYIGAAKDDAVAARDVWQWHCCSC